MVLLHYFGATTLVESRNTLFRKYDIAGFTRRSLAVYEAEGANWPREDRLLYLESLGYLGDPRLDFLDKARWITIPSGSFLMGSEDGDDDEEPIHRVSISEDFLLGRFPVTNQEYREFMEDGGDEREELWDPQARIWFRLKPDEYEAWFAEREKEDPFSQYLNRSLI